MANLRFLFGSRYAGFGALCAALSAGACDEGGGTGAPGDSLEAGDAGGAGGAAADTGVSGGSTGGNVGGATGGTAGQGGLAGAAPGGTGGAGDTDASVAGTGGEPPDQCTHTNAGVEICDDIDNDCNGKVDDLTNWTTIQACGSCDLRCDRCPTDGTLCDIPQFVADPTCVPPDVLDGTTKGACTWTRCADDYWDVDQNAVNGCEYFCQENPTRDPTQQDIGGTFPGENKGCGFDDDCDGTKDDSPIDDGETCGSSIGSCVPGTKLCNSVNKPACTGSDCFECVGATTPVAETCNGLDDNCDGVTDGTVPTGVPFACTSDAHCSSGRLCMQRATLSDKVCALPACAP